MPYDWSFPVTCPAWTGTGTRRTPSTTGSPRAFSYPIQGKSIYVYEQEFTVQSSTFLRKGFIGLQRLDRERILTHEQTRKKAKADREQLIGTLKTYTSFIFGLYDDREKRSGVSSTPHR